ncbi:MAG: DUF58 domain-containing protein [Hyphomicrobiaceae bacterium]|nr:DUF58 domain-containing protein [Hyphomicrobiaceae bacterium]
MPPIADSNRISPLGELEARAYALAERIPSLLVAARRVSHTVAHGIHGRRRRGPGETFWQFRHFENGDAADTIDWRRSASSDHLYVREREWEAAHTAWIWVDMSLSMAFRSHLSRTSKIDRAIVLSLAIGDLLVRGGERIGFIGGRARAGRLAVTQLALSIARRAKDSSLERDSLPPAAALGEFSECLLFSDFLEPVDELIPRLEQLAMQGVRGHLVQILDPAEESLPYRGRTEFTGAEDGERMIAGRAESLRERYHERLASHRRQLNDALRRLEWSLLVHHTDRPAEEALLALHARLAGLEHDYRYRPSAEALDDDVAVEPTP